MFSSKKREPIWFSLVTCFFLISLLVACSSSTPAPLTSHATPTSIPTAKFSPTPTPILGSTGCHPPSPLDTSNSGFLEAPGTTQARDLWVLFLGGVPPVKVTAKIIWKDGESFQDPIQVVGLGPQGERLQPLFLQKHGNSNWDRPGAEWGTAFNFPVAGCWDLHVTGGKTVGDVWVIITRN